MSSSRPTIVNPYAKKRKASSTSSAAAVTRGPTSNQVRPATGGQNVGASNRKQHHSSVGGGLAPLDLGGGDTFSQAFGIVDETVHYQKEMKSMTSTINVAEQQERAQQRAMDRQEHHHQQQQQQRQQASLTDKDHHILLQPHVLYVSERQRGNGLLKYIRNVPFAYSKMVPDYIMSTTTCALFLSLKYHQLYPNYIYRRISLLKTDFTLRVLLVFVDVDDNANLLLFLNKLAVTHNLTLILAWSEEEAARYLETFKALQGKDASSIQKRESTNFIDQVADFLTSCKPINKTDSLQLVSHFTKVKSILAATKDELALCPGIGPIKVQRLYDALHKPFSKKVANERKRKRERNGETQTQQQQQSKEHQVQQNTRQEKPKQKKKKPTTATATTTNIINLKDPPSYSTSNSSQQTDCQDSRNQQKSNNDTQQRSLSSNLSNVLPAASSTSVADAALTVSAGATSSSATATTKASSHNSSIVGVNNNNNSIQMDATNTIPSSVPPTTSVPTTTSRIDAKPPKKKKVTKISLSSFVGKVEKTNQVMNGAPTSSSKNDIDLDSALSSGLGNNNRSKGSITTSSSRSSSASTAGAPPPPAYTAASNVVTSAVAEHSATAGTRLSAPTDKGSTISSPTKS